jgi:hypothetical protein
MRRNGTRREEGISVLESLFALLLLAAVAQGGWTVLSQFRKAASDVAERAEGLETVRTIGWLLPEEVSGGRPEGDWWANGDDSLALRAFRGVGLVKGGTVGGDRLRVCFRGIRSPNADKDSVLLLGKDGRWRAHELRGRVRAEAECPGLGGGWEEVWTLSPEPGDAILGRVFERGSYHLVNGALRYRRGDGGRQPLTPERLQSGRLVGPNGEGAAISWEVELRRARPRADSSLWRGRVW